MKEIVLKSLTLINWRGEKKRTTHFNPLCTTISGANGLGKSRHFDAFTWLLFGKDTQDRKDYKIKTYIDGETESRTRCEVEGVLLVNKEELTLKRVYAEEWVRPRGQEAATLKGHKTECFWNNVPVNVKEHQRRVNELIDEKAFKIITNPLFFLSMPWKQQRDILFQIAGTKTDVQIAENNKEFAALLERIGNKGFEDFKKELSTKKRKLNEELREITPRIDQTRQLMPLAQDFDKIEMRCHELNEQLQSIEAAIIDGAQSAEFEFSERKQLQQQINTLIEQRLQVFNQAKQERQKEITAQTQLHNEAALRYETLQQQLQHNNTRLKSQQAQTERIEITIRGLNAKAESLRTQWKDENQRQYTELPICPCCKQTLPEHMQQEAYELFQTTQQEKLNAITTAGRSCKAELDIALQELTASKQSEETLFQENKALQKEIALAQLEKEAYRPSPQPLQIEDIEICVKLGDEINKLQNELNSQKSSTPQTDNFVLQKREIQKQLGTLQTLLHDKQRIAECNEQIQELESRGREIAQQIADLEKEEYTIQEFTKAKISDCESRINALFSKVRFQLFEYNIEDTQKEYPIETCTPFVDGAPFATTNTANQINAGLDVINTITRFQETTAPVFIDNAESINQLLEIPCQTIRLVVTNDSQLVIS